MVEMIVAKNMVAVTTIIGARRVDTEAEITREVEVMGVKSTSLAVDNRRGMEAGLRKEDLVGRHLVFGLLALGSAAGMLL